MAKDFAASITLGAGQFCTNPGILLGFKGEAFDGFLTLLGQEIHKVQPQKMLHRGIYEAYQKGLQKMLDQSGMRVVAQSAGVAADMEAMAYVARTDAADFLQNKHLKEDVFGPFSLAVDCDDSAQMMEVLQSLTGQLTSTIMATGEDMQEYADVIGMQHALAGRITLNNVPAGVEVCASIVHGGPYPATTDARFTSVGTMAINRWVRPVCYQNFTDAMLPDELKNNNPLGIMRMVNNHYTRERMGSGRPI